MRINYGQNVYNYKEIKAVLKTLKKGTQMGSNVKKMELRVANLFKKKFCLMTNSGSSALLLLSEILKIKKDDEFIAPILTFPTSISPFLQKGMVPRFVDVDINNLQILVKDIENKINKKTKLLIIPNLIGNIPDWEKIKRIAKKYNLITIEDSADTIGATINKESTGKFSDYSITSFYGSHIISCMGNGGALMLNKKKDYLKAKVIRSWGRTSSLFQKDNFSSRFKYKLNTYSYDKKFIFSEIGYNLEPSEVGAAFGIEQIKKLKTNTRIRKKNFDLHLKFFEKFNNFFYLPKQIKKTETSWLAFPLTIKKNNFFDRKKLQIFLENNNIQTRPIFTGNILYQPAFKYLQAHNKDKYINADQITEGGILIGLHHGINPKGIKYIHKKFNNFFEILKIKI